MRRILIIYVLALVFSLIQAEQKGNVQKSEVTKLEVVDLGEIEVETDSKQSEIQRKRDSGYSYSRPNRIASGTRFRFQVHPSGGEITSKIPSYFNRAFAKYGPPNHSISDANKNGYHVQQHRNKLHHASQQQGIGFDSGLAKQKVPSPIRNIDFTEVNPIASQNNEPFAMHAANYLPPQNQKLPAYSLADNFIPQLQSQLDEQIHDSNFRSQDAMRSQNYQISDAALFLSDNAQAIQQLYGAPASNQDFAPSNEFPDLDSQIRNPNDRLRNFEDTSESPEEFRNALPSYASGTLNSQESLEQIQSLEKDRLIVQLQRALAQAQTISNAESMGRYAHNQASFIQNQELLASINQQMKSHIPSQIFGSENTAFSQSSFVPGTTASPSRFPLNYGVSTTTQLPTTTVTGISTTRPLQASRDDGTTQISPPLSSSSIPAQPESVSSLGIPVYGGFVPTFITGTNFSPSYATSIFTSGLVRPVSSSGSSPTHFGIPLPAETTSKPALESASLTPITTTSSSILPSNRPNVPLAPAITPVAVPVQPIRPIAAPLHPVTTPVHSISNPLHPALPGGPIQTHPIQASTAITSSVYPTYGLQTPLINPVLYKPVKAVYPVYYYPNLAYQLQKPALPSYPWNYAPSYPQAKPAQIWK